MANEYKTKPLTLATLEKYNKKVLLPDIKEVVNERMRHYTDKILKSNDKVIKELKPLRKKQKTIDETDIQLGVESAISSLDPILRKKNTL